MPKIAQRTQGTLKGTPHALAQAASLCEQVPGSQKLLVINTGPECERSEAF